MAAQARQSQADRSRATRAALTTTARGLFAERGYADVSAAEIVSAAGLTRGALYHHYTDKADLFRAVVVELELEMYGEIQAAAERVEAEGVTDPIAIAAASLDAYLSACERDDIVRIMLTDAPTVLGWRGWRDIEHEHGLGLLMQMLEELMAGGLMPRQPVKALAQLLNSALIEAALLVADARESADRTQVRAEVRQAVLTLFSGLLAGN
ncbi:MAG TPA: helix-turn-helix domain-containing protein [Pseudonocardiaceae bacterium]|nr:helix-turn-helix domain-containing protein [Pseudonocardiaceae bacterium]